MAIMATDIEKLDLVVNEHADSMAEVVPNRGIDTVDEHSLLDAPRARLKAVANGTAPLRVEDVESVLVDHALDADQRAKGLGQTASELVEFLLSDQRPDPEATLRIVKDLSGLSRANGQEMRRTIELLTRIRRQPPPRVQVVAVDGQVNVGDKQINSCTLEVGD